MSNGLLATVSCLAVLCIGTVVATQRPEWLPEVIQPGDPPILVFLVGDARAVAHLREVVADERVVVESPRAVAMVEERIVAADADAASDLLNRADWVERDVELFTVAPKDWLGTRRRGPAAGDVDPERLARLREIARKPTLSAGEQMLVLQAMNEGIQF